MPHALKLIARAAMPRRLPATSVRPVGPHPSHRSRSLLFFVADLVFLVLAGIAATLTMHLVHQLEWPFPPMFVIGMIAAMLIQMLMAFAVAPLPGSIESMVPSMAVAMVSPMTICALHLFGCESTWMMSAIIGTTFAVGTFTLIQLDAQSCRKALGPQTAYQRG